MSRQTPAPETPEVPQVVNLEGERAELVQAELVRMHRSAAGSIEAEEVEVTSGLVGNLSTGRLAAQQAAIGTVQAAQVQASGMVGVVRAETAGVQGMAGVVFSNHAHVEQTRAGAVIGREVRADRIQTRVLLAGHVEGEVHTQMDARGALLAGALAGLVTGLVLLIGRMLFGRHDE